MAHLSIINEPAPHNSFSFSFVQSLWPGIIGEGVNEEVCLLGEVLPNFFSVLDLENFPLFYGFQGN